MSVVDDGRTVEYRGIRFRTVGKGIQHCQTCLRTTHNYVGHAEWHATGVGEIGFPAVSPLEPGLGAVEVRVAPATLATPTEVDALPARAVIRDAAGTVAENAGGPYPWLSTGFSESWPSEAFTYPVTVLWPLGARGDGGA